MNKHTRRQTTVRVLNELAADADAYCAQVGLTFNALVAVALSEFLRLRRRRQKAARSASSRAIAAFQPGRNTLCTCGSGRKYKKCCGNPLRVVPT
jgi:uncharacterized protein YecA (UPF0149 family)